jgi:hypothetical protein
VVQIVFFTSFYFLYFNFVAYLNPEILYFLMESKSFFFVFCLYFFGKFSVSGEGSWGFLFPVVFHLLRNELLHRTFNNFKPLSSFNLICKLHTIFHFHFTLNLVSIPKYQFFLGVMSNILNFTWFFISFSAKRTETRTNYKILKKKLVCGDELNVLLVWKVPNFSRL